MAERGSFSRRSFLVAGASLLAGCARMPGLRRRRAEPLTFGLFADPQYADRDPAIGRFYRESADKLAACIAALNAAKPAFAVCLGDLLDNAKTLEAEDAAFRRINGSYRQFRGPRHYVLGNHELGVYTKEQFIARAGMPAAHYSFDCGAFHFVILDANYRKDLSPYSAGNFNWTESYIPPAEQDWLAGDLKRAAKQIVVFVHEPLDDEKGPHGVKNAPEVRRVLETSGKVRAVFQGHNHAGAYRHLAGIHYVTMRGMVEGSGPENNAYALVRLRGDGAVEVQGFGKQRSYSLETRGVCVLPAFFGVRRLDAAFSGTA